MDEMLKELQALIDKYKDGTPKGVSDEQAEKDAERMSQLTAEIEKRTAADAAARESRAARIAAARSAIDNGTAHQVGSLPLSGGVNARSAVYDVTDYSAAETRGFLKNLATSAGVRLVEGNDLNDVERTALTAMEQRAAFTVTTSNTDKVVPVELKNEIISLIDNSTALFSDVTRDTIPGQYELVRHKSITKGDAAKTAEGAAPTDEEQNVFDRITLTGDEIKKTVKLSRKMMIQSLDSFRTYINREVSARCGVAGDKIVLAKLVDGTLGMAAGNKINVAKAGTLTKADVMKALSLLKTYGNPAAKGVRIYANQSTIWNQIAAIEDATKRSYFIDERDDDPTVKGRIFGSIVKLEDNLEDGVIMLGYPDLFRSNLFDGPVVEAVTLPDGSWNTAINGYMLYDGGLAVPESFVQLTVGTA
ncbi:phage major capsid protein [uncultured Collinsella sp.]|uniref:phage major capsid protein n=1 Tax=uncultured Collinsella sp. TaxID=165190 RepID=UPI0026725B2D|nr:phage major capsid protein [uncultured Collinsella sp.]